MNDGLGVWLRRAREARQLTLEDAEKTLRIRQRYLQALEMGDYTALPGTIQARGFLRNYVRFLGLPIEEALARYDAEIQGRPVQPRTHAPIVEQRTVVAERPSVFSPPPSEVEESASAGKVMPSELLLGLVVVLGFFIFIAIGSLIWLQFLEAEPTVTQTPTVTLSADASLETSLEETVAAPTVFPVSADGKVNIRLVPLGQAWISLTADERVVFQGIIDPQQVLEASADEILIVSTGNGGAFRLYINGTDFGDLGAPGEIIRRAWGPAGELDLEGS